MPTPNPYLSPILAVNGGKAQTFPLEGAPATAQTAVLGTTYVDLVTLPGDTIVTGAGVYCTTAVTTPSHTWFALLQAVAMGGYPVLEVLAVTPDALLTAVGLGFYQLEFTNPPFSVPGDGGVYYIAFLSAGATAGAFLGVTNLANTFTPMLSGTAGTGGTVPPAVGTQVAAGVVTASTISLWVEIF